MPMMTSVDHVQLLARRLAAADERVARAEREHDEPAVLTSRADLAQLRVIARQYGILAVT